MCPSPARSWCFKSWLSIPRNGIAIDCNNSFWVSHLLASSSVIRLNARSRYWHTIIDLCIDVDQK